MVARKRNIGAAERAEDGRGARERSSDAPVRAALRPAAASCSGVSTLSEQPRRIAERRRARRHASARALGSASASAPARRSPAASRRSAHAPAHRRDSTHRAARAGRLAVHRHHGASHPSRRRRAAAAQQGAGHERHVPRDDDDRHRPARRRSAVRDARERTEPRFGRHATTRAPGNQRRRARIVRDDELRSWRRAARRARGRRCAARPRARAPSACPPNRRAAPPASSTPTHAMRCMRAAQMRSPRCSAARSSSVVSARSTSSDSMPAPRPLLEEPSAPVAHHEIVAKLRSWRCARSSARPRRRQPGSPVRACATARRSARRRACAARRARRSAMSGEPPQHGQTMRVQPRHDRCRLDHARSPRAAARCRRRSPPDARRGDADRAACDRP